MLCPRELFYWVGQKFRELMAHTTIQDFLSEIFDESMHDQILESLVHRRELGNHVDLDSCTRMLLKTVFSRGGQRQEFIVNKLLNKWFEASSFVPPGYSTDLVACINITHGAEGNFVKNKFDLVSKGLWFHGTTYQGAKSIRKSGTFLIYSHTKTNFGWILPVA